MTESSESQTASPDVIRVAAPLLLGPVFNWALYGVLSVQIYVYCYNFPKDKRSIKFLVFLLETIQTALTGADVYYWFVAGFGNVERLGNSHFSPIDVPIISSAISLSVQGYFCYRIWVLNERSSWICWIIAVAAVTQSVAATWSSIKCLKAEAYIIVKTTLYLWSISSAFADILIAVAMTLLLRRGSSNYSSFVLVRVVRLTIETNALTAALAITSLVLYVAFPKELYFVYTVEVIGKVYSNTLLVSLNNRIYLRDHQSSEHGNGVPRSVPDRAHLTTATATPPSLRPALPEPRLQALMNHIFSRFFISRPVDLESSEGDDTAADSSVPRLREFRLLPEDPEWAMGITLHPFGQKDELYES
ncbi:hypothetical protein EI94DRAFT_1795052 [Lactarius quietus]|nr:hypothetical protein EI94DRAFT_1795052 [Lactarius quietus]